MSQPAANWYPDPHGQAALRYWDGQRWTGHTLTAGPPGPGPGGPAPWLHRAGAVFVDSGIVQLAVFPLAFSAGLTIGLTAPDVSELVVNLIGGGIGLVVGALYYVLLMRRRPPRTGQTVGKQILSLRVVRADGSPLTTGRIVLRELVVKLLLFGVLSLALLYIPTLLNYLWPLWDDENRALHDMLAGTRVVRS